MKMSNSCNTQEKKDKLYTICLSQEGSEFDSSRCLSMWFYLCLCGFSLVLKTQETWFFPEHWSTAPDQAHWCNSNKGNLLFNREKSWAGLHLLSNSTGLSNSYSTCLLLPPHLCHIFRNQRLNYSRGFVFFIAITALNDWQPQLMNQWIWVVKSCY